MNVIRVISAVAGLVGLYLLVASLSSLFSGGAVMLPGVGQKEGGMFLVIVSLIITVGAFAGFFRMKRR